MHRVRKDFNPNPLAEYVLEIEDAQRTRSASTKISEGSWYASERVISGLVALPGLRGCCNLAQHAHLRDGFISTDCNAVPRLHTTAQGTQRVFVLSKFWNGGGGFEVWEPYCAVEKAASGSTFRHCWSTWLTRLCFSVHVSSADLTRRGCAARPC